MEEYDLVIIGGGPAGITAAIYGGRANLKTLLMESSVFGGKMMLTDHIENYPGFKRISGSNLTRHMLETLSLFKVDKINLQVNKIEPHGSSYLLYAGESKFLTAAIIVATGTYARHLEVKGEQEYLGRGVSYCAVCDGAFFEGEEVVVVGGGDSAVQEALFLTQYASKVKLVHRRDKLRAVEELARRARGNNKIDILWNSVITEIKGNEMVQYVTVTNTLSGDSKEVPARGVFIYTGIKPRVELVQDYVELSPGGFIRTDIHMQTSARGIFAAGDVREKPLRQISTAVGDAAVAAISAAEYVLSLRSS